MSPPRIVNDSRLEIVARPCSEWHPDELAVVVYACAALVPGARAELTPPPDGMACTTLAPARLDVPGKPESDLVLIASKVAQGARVVLRRGDGPVVERPVVASFSAEAAAERALPYAGTYDERWLAERWPRYPVDLDARFFQASPPELRFAAFAGDEELVLEGLTREPLRLGLPALRPRAFVDDIDTSDATERRFREVPLALDTLCVDVDARTLVLVWRGRVRAHEADVAYVYLASEACADAPLDAAAYRERLDARLAAETPLPVVEVEPEPPAENDDAVPELDEAELEPALSALRGELERAGASRAVLQAFDGRDFDGLFAALERDGHVDPKRADELRAASHEKFRSMLRDGGHDPTLFDADFAAEDHPEGATKKLTREDVSVRHRAGRGLEGADLAELDLSELDLEGAKLAGAILTRANLARARLAGADLGDATLEGADLRGTRLEGARLARADLTQANLAGADLTGACLDHALLAGADLSSVTAFRASAVQADFTHAILALATFAEADLSNAILASCRLDRTSFHGARLTTAVLERAEGESPDFSEANLEGVRAAEGTRLLGANLRAAKVRGGVWTDAELNGADASLALFARADLSGASLEGARFDGADLCDANLERARLGGASFVAARLQRARLAEADLRAADLRKSCLFEAETLASARAGARFEGAELGGTKLAPGAPRLPEGV